MGAAVAIIAARERSIQHVADAFRIADATSPDRAKSLNELAIPSIDEAERMLDQGLIVAGPREGTFYLDEMAFISRRNQRTWRAKIIVLSMLAVLIGLLLIPMMMMRTQ